MDVDGTLTDGKIYMGHDGEVFKAFDIKDGYGIKNILPKYNIIPVVITARTSNIVKNRCQELGITECWQGVQDKLEKMREIAKLYLIQPDEKGVYQEIAYIGDDIIDLSCMKYCGLVACPADAVLEVKKVSSFISKFSGGHGAVREFIEEIVNNRNI